MTGPICCGALHPVYGSAFPCNKKHGHSDQHQRIGTSTPTEPGLR